MSRAADEPLYLIGPQDIEVYRRRGLIIEIPAHAAADDGDWHMFITGLVPYRVIIQCVAHGRSPTGFNLCFSEITPVTFSGKL